MLYALCCYFDENVTCGGSSSIPHLVVSDAAAALDYYRLAFGAELGQEAPTPDVHLEIAGARPERRRIRLGR